MFQVILSNFAPPLPPDTPILHIEADIFCSVLEHIIIVVFNIVECFASGIQNYNKCCKTFCYIFWIVYLDWFQPSILSMLFTFKPDVDKPKPTCIFFVLVNYVDRL